MLHLKEMIKKNKVLLKALIGVEFAHAKTWRPWLIDFKNDIGKL